ncbi:MAG: hypothetical protein Q9227_000586 [Pyrenula ochraceoflavens]
MSPRLAESMGRTKSTMYERQRRFGAKTRTGCTTCKARHLKCDESKPICCRCAKSGRKCLYDSTRSIPFEVFDDPAERKLFQHFREKTINQWSGLDDYQFWNGPITQASLSHPEIRHVITAIAARHEGIDKGLTKENGLDESPEYAAAVEQSNKAIALLRDPCSNLPIGVLIISCVLFTIFESLQDDQIPIRYIKNAMDLVKSLSTHAHGTPSTEEMIFLRAEIFPMLARICQRFYTGLDQPFALRVYLSTTPRKTLMEPDMPSCFSSLLEANSYLDKYRTWAHMNTSRPLLAGKPVFGPEAQLRLDRLTQEWNKALDASLGQTKSFPSSVLMSQFRRDVALLKAHQKFILLRLHATTLATEAAYDSLYTDLREMITLYQLSLRDGSEQSLQPCYQRPYNFGLSSGVIEPLFFAATRCRDPTLRREAIDLLRISSIPREGIWDPMVMSLLAEAVMDLEEEGLLPSPRSSSDIPLSSRIVLVSMAFYSATGRVTLSYHRCVTDAPMQQKSVVPSIPSARARSISPMGNDDSRPELILGRGYCSFLVNDLEEYYSLTPETHSFGQFV